MSPSNHGQGPPVGLRLDAVARRAGRAFDDALGAAGGSRPVWLVLLALKRGSAASQKELADTIGIRGATLTHHLSAMESRGLVSRVREAGDRRNQIVGLTEAGLDLFNQLRVTAHEFDARLREGISEDDARVFANILTRIEVNLTADQRDVGPAKR